MSTPHAPRKGSLAYVPTKHSKEQIVSCIKTKPEPGLAYRYYVKTGMIRRKVQGSVLGLSVLEQIPLCKEAIVYYNNNNQRTTKDKAVRANILVRLNYSQLSHPRKDKKQQKATRKEIPYYGTLDDAENLDVNLSKEFTTVDVIGITKGKGFTGPVKRKGIKLQVHKANGKRRHAGALGTREPGKLSFRTPLAGQMGHARRTILNLHCVGSTDQKLHFPHYGWTRKKLLLIKGAVSGPIKGTVAVRSAIRCIGQ